MTLSLDDVRNKRFRMARKSGYEVLEVDEFVDEIEESFAQLIEENQNLKKQVESLKSSEPVAASASPQVAVQPAATTPPANLEKATAPQAPLVVTTAKEASSAVVRLVELSTEQAERLVKEAVDEANRIREEASSSAQQLTTDAKTSAERVESEARIHAERVQAQALSRAEQLNQEIDARRADMFGELEQQRDALTSAVADLRRFEATYRSNLTNHLRSQIHAIESGNAAPSEVPELAKDVPPARGRSAAEQEDTAVQQLVEPEGAGPEAGQADGNQPKSDTPRLDALLGDQR
jgi:DivIVA domain-containing protein